MKRRDLLKGLLGIPAAIVGARVANELPSHERQLAFTLPNDTADVKFEVVDLKCKQYTAKIRWPQELLDDACIDLRSAMAADIQWTYD